MYDSTCSSDLTCGNCGKKSSAGGAVTCPLSSAKTGTTTATVCTLCADNGNECCTTPTCDNIDGVNTALACPTGMSLKQDLSAISCATGVCAAADCCRLNLCAVTNGKTSNSGVGCKCGTSECTPFIGMFCQTNTCHTSAFGSAALPNGDGSHLDPGGGLRKVVSDWIGGGDLKKTVITTYGSIENWQVSGVTNMKYVFYQKNTFNADLSKWNVAAVSDMYRSTYNSTSFLTSLFF